MGTPSPVQVLLSTTSQGPIWMGTRQQGDTVTLINFDPVYTMYIGWTSTIMVGGQNTFPLQPGGPGVTVPADKPIYAVSLATTPLTILPGSIQYAPVTSGIAASIVPASTFAGVVIPTGAGVSAGAVFPVANFTSYNISVAAHCTSQGSAGAPYTLAVTLTWFDGPGGFNNSNLLGQETWEVWVGNAAPTSTAIARGAGPMLGPYMTITATNPSSTQTINVDSLVVDGNMRSITQSDWRQAVPPMTAQAGFTLLGAAPAAYIGPAIYENIVASDTGMTLVASSSNWMPLPLFTGSFAMRFQTGTVLTSNPVLAHSARLTNGAIVGGVAMPGVIWNGGNVTTEQTAQLIAPRVPLSLIMIAAAGAPTITFVAMALGKPS